MSTKSLEQELTIEGIETISNIIYALESDRKGIWELLHPHSAEGSFVPLMVPLYSLIEWMHSESLKSILAEFESIDIDGMRYLKNEAVAMDEEGVARTYLFMDVLMKPRILGFFTVSTSHINVPEYEDIPIDLKLSLNISDSGCATTYLISHACNSVDANFPLELTIRSAMSIIYCSWKTIGCRIVRMDCTDEKRHFFEDLGFHFIRRNEDYDLNQMLFVI